MERRRRRRRTREREEIQPLLLPQVLFSLDLSWLLLASSCLYENVGTAPKALLCFMVYKLLQLPKHTVRSRSDFFFLNTAIFHVQINMVLHLSAFSDFLGKRILMRQNPDLDGKKSKWVYLYVSYPASFSASIYYKSHMCITYSLQCEQFPCNSSES